MGREELLKLLPIQNLPDHIEIIDNNIKFAGAKTVFQDHISRLAERRGKRLRPILLMASAQLCGRKIDKSIIGAATALELIHEASLVHDDVIDGDSQLDPGSALLLGDFLIAAGLGLAGSLSLGVSNILSSAVKSLAEGQAMQMMRRYKTDISDAFYIETVEHKTAVLFEAACRLGAGEAPAAGALRRYGTAFGMAFQIVDDIADSDFMPSESAKARQSAEEYCQKAARNLSDLRPGPLQSSLMEIPQLYLELSLP